MLRGRWDYLGGSWRDLGSVPWGPWSALVGSPGGLRGLEGSLERWEAFWEIIGGGPGTSFPTLFGGKFAVGISKY